MCLLPCTVLTMNSQRSSSTSFTPHELFHGGRLAWFFKTPFPEDYKSPVGDWLEHKQALANLARANLKQVRERELTRRNRCKRPATFRVGDWCLCTTRDRPHGPATVCRTLILGLIAL